MDLKDRIDEVINNSVNPVLAAHGGSAHVSCIEGDTVWVKMDGACAACGFAAGDVDTMIEKVVTDAFPSIKHVELDDSVDDEMYEFAKKLLGSHGKIE
ncbi:MAG: NifU family protein [Anaerovoracaceae bacterium]|nr:NifU family protein [Anaerovoracaceae bacterium]